MSDQPENEEQREISRRPVRTWAEISLAAGGTFRARTLDFSIKGLAIVAPSNLAAKTVLAVSCVIPMRNGKFVSFQARGHVTYSIFSSKDDGFRIGIEFDELTRSSATMLQQLVA